MGSFISTFVSPSVAFRCVPDYLFHAYSKARATCAACPFPLNPMLLPVLAQILQLPNAVLR
eukprot:IDg7038t1